MITQKIKDTAIAALRGAIAGGTPLNKYSAIDPDTGAMCSCAVIAFALGWEPDRIDGSDVYRFLGNVGFEVDPIWQANDRDDCGGFEGAIDAIQGMWAS